MPYQIIEARSDTELITKLTAAINSNLLPVGSLEYTRGVWYIGVQTGTASAAGAVAIVACPDSIRLNNNVNLQLIAGFATLGSTVMRNGQYVQVMTKGVPAAGSGGTITASQISDSTATGRALITAADPAAARGTVQLSSLVSADPVLTYTGTGVASRLTLTSTGAPSALSLRSDTTGSSMISVSAALTVASANSSVVLGAASIDMSGMPVTVQGGGGIGIRPTANNAVSCGTAATGWTAVYAQSATITPSDQRLKTQPEAISDAILDAWATVDWISFKFLNGGVRTHIGVIAQQVQEAFTTAGIDPSTLALFCYDAWDAVPDGPDIEVDGEVIPGAKGYPAGDRYSIRYEEALALEAALMRRELKRLKGV